MIFAVFLSMAVNTIDKLQFLSFISLKPFAPISAEF